MKIKRFEQSGFILETENGYKLAVDIGSYTPIEKLNEIFPDAMIVSHIHGDHFSVEQIKKLSPNKLYLNEECVEALGEESIPSEIIEVKVGDRMDVGGIRVQLFDVDHGPNIKVRPRENFGFLIEADGKELPVGVARADHGERVVERLADPHGLAAGEAIDRLLVPCLGVENVDLEVLDHLRLRALPRDALRPDLDLVARGEDREELVCDFHDGGG